MMQIQTQLEKRYKKNVKSYLYFGLFRCLHYIVEVPCFVNVDCHFNWISSFKALSQNIYLFFFGKNLSLGAHSNSQTEYKACFQRSFDDVCVTKNTFCD